MSRVLVVAIVNCYAVVLLTFKIDLVKVYWGELTSVKTKN